MIAVASYVDLTTADQYFNTHIAYDFQSGLSSDIKLKLLVTASQRIDTLQFIGIPISQTQVLQQPRDIDEFIQTYNSILPYEFDLPLFQWLKINVNSSEVPSFVKKAVLEYALYISMNFNNIQYAIDSQIFDSIDVGGMFSVRYKNQATSKTKPVDTIQDIPNGVLRILSPVLVDNMTYEITNLLVTKQLDIKQKAQRLNMGQTRIMQ